MANIFVSEKQKELFAALEACEELIFGGGPTGVVTNLVGKFTVRPNHHGEDQLDVGDGTCHVHLDWAKVKRVELGDFHGEGMLTFFDGEEKIFRFYNPNGAFPDEVLNCLGDLI